MNALVTYDKKLVNLNFFNNLKTLSTLRICKDTDNKISRIIRIVAKITDILRKKIHLI